MLSSKEDHKNRSPEQSPSPDERLNELNAICQKCMTEKAKRFEMLSGKDCMYCPTGIEIHSLDSRSWDKVDWNSAKWGKYYRF